MELQTHIQGQKLVETIIEKSWEDNTFKERLISNPTNVISEVIGKDFSIPGEVDLIVNDQSDSSVFYLNIPRRPGDIDTMELTDEQLEMVAGGEVGWVVAAVVVFAIGYAIA